MTTRKKQRGSTGADQVLHRDLEIYGALKAEAHIGAYSLERAFERVEVLLAGDRWRLGDRFDDPGKFLDSLRLDEFRAVAEQRKRIALRIKKLQPTVSNRAIARTLGVDEGTVRGDLAAENSAAPLENPNDANGAPSAGAENSALAGTDAAKLVLRTEAKAERAQETLERREASRGAVPIPDGMELRIGDCRQALADVPDNSVPLILTDPPYGDEAGPLYEWLAEFGARVLIPGGSLICYTGQSRLNRDIHIFDQHLRYWWLLTMPHDQSQRLAGKFVIAGFKPVLWYVKDHRRGRSLVPDVLKSPARDKELHNWSQGDGGISPLIEHLTDPGELIVDPFAGTAAWGRNAIAMGRRWLGSDVIEGGGEIAAAAE
jgi:site-specific DNA-methyltransferase (adenine-specific)